jgi:hypothetical protein
MEGGEAFPGDNRHITGYATPASFAPVYGVSTTKDAADLAMEASNAAAAVRHAEEAKKAQEDAELKAA